MSADAFTGSARDYWDQVEEVFAAVVAAEDSARTAVLTARCAARPELRVEVEGLLAAHARAADFITPHTGAGGGSEAALAAGARVGAFRLIERIARGGMGDVYRAERVEGEFTQQVAIKLIAPELSESASFRERFLAETELAASLEHPNVVPIHNAGEVDGQLYIAMRYVEDGELRSLLQSEKRLEPARPLELVQLPAREARPAGFGLSTGY